MKKIGSFVLNGKLFAAFALLLALSIHAVHASAPNIVFILADDLDNGIFEKEDALQSLLAGQGTIFDNHFVSLSLCCPSRVTTLRGQYAHNNGVHTNTAPEGGFGRAFADGLENSSIVTWLQSAGYRTALIGKYLNGYPGDAPINRKSQYIPPEWDYFVSPNRGDPYSEYIYGLNENGVTVGYGNKPEDYLTDVISGHAVHFIREAANHPNQPFFLYLTPYAPHAPATPPPRYEQELKRKRVPRTASFNETDVSDKPAWVQALPLLSRPDFRGMSGLYRKHRHSSQFIRSVAVGHLAKNGLPHDRPLRFGNAEAPK